MRINECLRCDLPCTDVKKELFAPQPTIQPEKVKLVLVSEAPPSDHADYYYGNSSGSFFLTTKIAFADAGCDVSSYKELSDMGIYLTTAIKCGKVGYLVKAETIRRCSFLLEQELDQFPSIKVILCMGDFAIKAMNYIAKRKFNRTVLPAGSTYKIRNGVYETEGIRYLPSYTQTGDSFNIEKVKRKMIAEDIAKALALISR
jgi:uracil-DNA glycosylase